jgi:hypothetical protein
MAGGSRVTDARQPNAFPNTGYLRDAEGAAARTRFNDRPLAMHRDSISGRSHEPRDRASSRIPGLWCEPCLGGGSGESNGIQLTKDEGGEVNDRLITANPEISISLGDLFAELDEGLKSDK